MTDKRKIRSGKSFWNVGHDNCWRQNNSCFRLSINYIIQIYKNITVALVCLFVLFLQSYEPSKTAENWYDTSHLKSSSVFSSVQTDEGLLSTSRNVLNETSKNSQCQTIISLMSPPDYNYSIFNSRTCWSIHAHNKSCYISLFVFLLILGGCNTQVSIRQGTRQIDQLCKKILPAWFDHLQ